MKEKKSSSFFLLASDSSKIRRIEIPRVLLVGVLMLVCISFLGFIRTSYILISYGYSRFGLYNEKKKNEVLLKKIEFLQKFSNECHRSITQLIEFEDNARLKLGLVAISSDIRNAGIGGVPNLKKILNDAFEDPQVKKVLHVENISEELLRKIAIQENTFSEVLYKIHEQNRYWSQRPSIWPVRGKITSDYGYRLHPFIGAVMFHEGIDIANVLWTPVIATAHGTVHFVGFRGHYGTSVIVQHKTTELQTVYAHLQQTSVVEGQYVKRGDLIGYLGNTGRSTGPHLHYEIRKMGRTVDPLQYILTADHIID